MILEFGMEVVGPSGQEASKEISCESGRREDHPQPKGELVELTVVEH
jgi:hypothetical protein